MMGNAVIRTVGQGLAYKTPEWVRPVLKRGMKANHFPYFDSKAASNEAVVYQTMPVFSKSFSLDQRES